MAQQLSLLSLKITTPALIASVKCMRVLCPTGVLGAVIVGYMDYAQGWPLGLAICAYCGGISTVLAWVQWCLFVIEERTT